MPLPALVLPLWSRPAVLWFWDAYRAWRWSAWRNSCDSLKYVFAWEQGPQATVWGRKLGWWPENSVRVPVW